MRVDVYRPADVKFGITDSFTISIPATPYLTDVRVFVGVLSETEIIGQSFGHLPMAKYKMVWRKDDIRENDIIHYKGKYYVATMFRDDTDRYSLQYKYCWLSERKSKITGTT